MADSLADGLCSQVELEIQFNEPVLTAEQVEEVQAKFALLREELDGPWSDPEVDLVVGRLRRNFNIDDLQSALGLIVSRMVSGDVSEGLSRGANAEINKKKECAVATASGKYLTENPLVGFGRGLSSVVTSPGNIIWGAGAGFVRFEMESPILGLGTAIGVLGGCGVCVSDIVLGCADMMTFGWLGNRYFYNENSWGITPWFFTHAWFK